MSWICPSCGGIHGDGESCPLVIPTHPTLTQQVQMLAAEGAERPHDWPEDFAHENGRYMCRCHTCNVTFHGHKRRVRCKVCAAQPTPPTPAGTQGEVAMVLAKLSNHAESIYRVTNGHPFNTEHRRALEVLHEQAAAAIATLTARVRELEATVRSFAQDALTAQAQAGENLARAESAERERDAAQARLAVVEGAAGAAASLLQESANVTPNTAYKAWELLNASLSPAPGSDKENAQ